MEDAQLQLCATLRSRGHNCVSRIAALDCTQSITRGRPHALSDIHRRVDTGVKKRLERLAKSTGRSRSFLAAEAINEYLDVNEWQVGGIKRAIASLDRGEGVPHEIGQGLGRFLG